MSTPVPSTLTWVVDCRPRSTGSSCPFWQAGRCSLGDRLISCPGKPPTAFNSRCVESDLHLCPECGGPLVKRTFIDSRDAERKPCDVNEDWYCEKCHLRWEPIDQEPDKEASTP